MPSSTPIYGLPYPLDTDPVPMAPSDIEDLALATETMFSTKAGLKRVIPTGTHTNITFDANGNGTPALSQSTFTIAGAFSASYDAYRIEWTGQASTVGTTWSISYPSITTGYYGTLIYNRPNASTPTGATDNNAARHTWLGWGGTSGNSMQFDVYQPFNSGVRAHIAGTYWETSSFAGAAIGQYAGLVDSTASITAITFTVASGVISTAGQVRIYGYTR